MRKALIISSVILAALSSVAHAEPVDVAAAPAARALPSYMVGIAECANVGTDSDGVECDWAVARKAAEVGSIIVPSVHTDAAKHAACGAEYRANKGRVTSGNKSAAYQTFMRVCKSRNSI